MAIRRHASNPSRKVRSRNAKGAASTDGRQNRNTRRKGAAKRRDDNGQSMAVGATPVASRIPPGNLEIPDCVDSDVLSNLTRPTKTGGYGCYYCRFYQWVKGADLSNWSGTRDIKRKHEIKTHCVQGHGSDSPIILFVGDSPGFFEDKTGIPFVGKVGDILQSYIESIGLRADDYRLTNVVRCRPPDNDTPTIAQCRACSPYLAWEIQKTKPKFIVPLGKIALQVVAGNKDMRITSMVGRAFDTTVAGHECTVFPMMHPASLLYDATDARTSEYGIHFDTLYDLAFNDGVDARKLATNTRHRKAGNWRAVTCPTEAKWLLYNMRRAGKPVAFDVETDSFSPYRHDAVLACVGFSNKEGTGFSIPVDIAKPHFVNDILREIQLLERENKKEQDALDKEISDGVKVTRTRTRKVEEHTAIRLAKISSLRIQMRKAERVQWTEAERESVFKEMWRLLTDPNVEKIAHNAKFDCQWVQMALAGPLGGEVTPHPFDTMLAHFALVNEERGTHRLDDLVVRFLPEMGRYWDAQKEATAAAGHKADAADDQERSTFLTDFETILGPYNAADVDACVRLYNMLTTLEDVEFEFNVTPQMEFVANTFMRRASAALTRMEIAGVALDVDIAKKMIEKKYEPEIKRRLFEIKTHPIVREYVIDRLIKDRRFEGFNWNSSQQMQDVLFGGTWFEEERKGHDKPRRVWVPGKRYFGYKAIKRSDPKKPTSGLSTDKQVLNMIRMEHGCEFCENIMEGKLDEKVVGTYLKPMIEHAELFDGKVHGRFNLHGTTTARLSSSNPNLQNIPNKSGGDVKRLFVSRWPDGLIAAADYSQMELRILAALSGDEGMLETYFDDKDLHLRTCLRIFNLSAKQYEALDPKEQKMKRTIAKRVNFGIAYGIGGPGIVNALQKEWPPVVISVDDASSYIDGFYDEYPGVKEWIERVENQIKSQGYIDSVFGRRRRLPDVFSMDTEKQARALRQGVNHCIQSPASDMNLTALTLMSEELTHGRYRGVHAHLIATVHDSDLFDVHAQNAVDVIDLIDSVMPNLPKCGHRVWGKKFSWKWLQGIPIKIDREIGVNWRDTVDLPSEVNSDVIAEALDESRRKRDELDGALGV